MKTAKLDPLKPSRSDYRIIHKILESSASGKVLHTDDGYEAIVRVFQRAGGSWQRLFLGSLRDMTLLKKIAKVAVKGEIFPPAPQWR